MNCDIPILNINEDDCIGDSIGKINYNFLALDTVLCNFKTEFTPMKSDLKTLSELFLNAPSYDTDFKNQVLLASTTVNLLSSLWGNYEFSISLPINAVSLDVNDRFLLAPTLSAINQENVARIANNTLKNLCEIELNTNHNPLSYPDFTIVNVNGILYNLIPAIVDPISKVDPLTKTYYFPSQTFNYSTRNINVTYNRDTIHVTTGIILRFYVKNKKWNYMGYIVNNDIHSAQPNLNTTAIYPQQQQNSIKTQAEQSNSHNYITPCNEINENTWYPVDLYVYSNCLYSGTSSKLGTVTLTLRTPENATKVFSYTAKGYDPATGTGGTDVYLEFDRNSINAYEQYPIPKTLVKSWENPYPTKLGVNFKYTRDTRGVSFVVCGSTGYLV